MDKREWYLCYVCGQNWIDQMYKNYHLRTSIGEEYDCSLSSNYAFGRMRNWDFTPQGRAVWTRRCDETNRYVSEKEFNH